MMSNPNWLLLVFLVVVLFMSMSLIDHESEHQIYSYHTIEIQIHIITTKNQKQKIEKKD